jgi:hypothetical protein
MGEFGGPKSGCPKPEGRYGSALTKQPSYDASVYCVKNPKPNSTSPILYPPFCRCFLFSLPDSVRRHKICQGRIPLDYPSTLPYLHNKNYALGVSLLFDLKKKCSELDGMLKKFISPTVLTILSTRYSCLPLRWLFFV